MPKSDKSAGNKTTTKRVPQGELVTLRNPVDRTYLCGRICACNMNARYTDILGRVLKQRCVTRSVVFDEDRNQQVWRYKAEVGFDMRFTPPKPYMSQAEPHRPSRFPLGAASKAWRLSDLEHGKQKGLLRIPDVTILKVTGAELAAMRSSGAIDWKRLIPYSRNIEILVEIKFPGDRFGPLQRRAYLRIAPVSMLTVQDCGCQRREKRVPVEAPVRVEVKAPAAAELSPVIPLPWPVPPSAPRPGPVPWGIDPAGTKPAPDPVPGPVGWNLPNPPPRVTRSGPTPFDEYVHRSLVVGEVILLGVVTVVAISTVEVWGPVLLAALLVGGASEAFADEGNPE